jgi:phosphoribosylformylglycinamidine synthase PurS subunit
VSVPDGVARVEVRVELKDGVVDAEAVNVLKSLSLLGIDHLADVHTARVYTLDFTGIPPEDAEKRAGEAVDRLLANPVVHRVSVTPVAP